MSNYGAHAALQRHIAKLRELGDVGERAAPAVAKELRRVTLAQVRRQQGPDGKPWPKTKAGTPALQGVAASLSVRAIGTVVTMRLDNHHARHHLGAVKGRVKRPVIPTVKIPDPAERAIRTVITREFVATMGGT